MSGDHMFEQFSFPGTHTPKALGLWIQFLNYLVTLNFRLKESEARPKVSIQNIHRLDEFDEFDEFERPEKMKHCIWKS